MSDQPPDLSPPEEGPQQVIQQRPIPVMNRLTVCESIRHNRGRHGPTADDAAFFLMLNHDEQPFDRNGQIATEEWKTLKFNWIEDCGCSMISIQNEEGIHIQTKPTEEEKAETKKKILELAYEGCESKPWLIPAGASIRVFPSSIEGLRIRSQYGSAKYTFRAYPS